jgi:hypothetical protein
MSCLPYDERDFSQVYINIGAKLYRAFHSRPARLMPKFPVIEGLQPRHIKVDFSLYRSPEQVYSTSAKVNPDLSVSRSRTCL